jgi:hypothetical protein
VLRQLVPIVVLTLFSSACGREEPPAAAAPPAESDVPHGDHNPHHGGVVMMQGDLHYEVVFDPAGAHRVYFTDAVREDLPAATASDVTVTIVRKGEPVEKIALQIDDAGESWVGVGRPVKDPDATTVRLAYTVKAAQPYWIDLPFKPPVIRTGEHR